MDTNSGIPEWMVEDILEALYHTHEWFCPMFLVGLAEEGSDG